MVGSRENEDISSFKLSPTHKPSGTSTTNSCFQWLLCVVVVGGVSVLASVVDEASVENSVEGEVITPDFAYS